MKKTTLLLAMMSFSLALSGCANLRGGSNSDVGAMYKNLSEPELFTAAETNLAKRNYTKAVKYYEALSELYPFGPHSQQAALDAIYAYYQTSDYVSAEAAADSYIHLYPRSANVDYAYYMKGMSQMYENRNYLQRAFPIDMSARDLTNAQQAFFTFRDLTQLIPSSQYVPYAKQQMIHLRNMFAQHELDVARYYYQKKAYVAASNRASYVVQHFQGTPQVADALVILVEANRALGADQAAADAYRVLQENYPDLPIVKKLA